MEITIRRKAVIQTVLYTVLAIVLTTTVYWAYSNDLFDHWLTNEVEVPMSIAEVPAMQALAAFYTPDVTGEQTAWEDKVCTGMSVQGCELFRKMYAPALWRTAQSKPLNITVAFLSVAETFDDSSQVWKMNLIEADTSKQIYIHVTQNESGKWLLNRVLFAQEAAKYENQ